MNKYYTYKTYSSISSINMYELIFEHFFKYIEQQYYLKKENPISDKKSITNNSSKDNDNETILLVTYLSNEIEEWKQKRKNFLISNSKYYDYHLQDNYLSSQNFNDDLIYNNIVNNAEATALQESDKAQQLIQEAKIKYQKILNKNLTDLHMWHPKYKNQEIMNLKDKQTSSFIQNYNDEEFNYENNIDIQNAMSAFHSNNFNDIDKQKNDLNSESFFLLTSPFLKNIDNSIEFNSKYLPNNQIKITQQCQIKINDISQSFLDKKKSIMPYSAFENLKNEFTLINLKSSINESLTFLIDFLKDISLLSQSNPNLQYEPVQDQNQYIRLFEKITYNHYLIKASFSNKIHQSNVYADGCKFQKFYPHVPEDSIKLSLFYLENILEILESIKENPYKHIQNSQVPLSILNLNRFFCDNFCDSKNISTLKYSNTVSELFLINTLSQKEILNKKLELEELKKNITNQLTPIIHQEIHNELSDNFQKKTNQITETITIELEKQARTNLDKLVMDKFMKIPSIVMDIIPIQNRTFNTQDLVNALNGLDIPNQEIFYFDIEYPKYQKGTNSSETHTILNEKTQTEVIKLKTMVSKMHNDLKHQSDTDLEKINEQKNLLKLKENFYKQHLKEFSSSEQTRKSRKNKI